MENKNNTIAAIKRKATALFKGKQSPPSILDRQNHDPILKDYYSAQITQSKNKAHKDAGFRYKTFGDWLIKNDLVKKIDSLLCVGCRNVFELDHFTSVGVRQVSGIDLFSIDPRIRIMDMHDMDFENGIFDALYSGDNFEHSLDPFKAAGEFVRVVKSGGLIMISIPANYETGEVDRIPFAGPEDLYKYFSGGIGKVLLEDSQLDQQGAVLGYNIAFTTGK